MNRRFLLVAAVLVGAVVIAGGWYLLSPLFLDDVVDEAFPFTIPDEAEMAEMTQQQVQAMEAEFAAAVPEEEELAAMPPAERNAVATRVFQAAAHMPGKEMDDAMPAEDADPVLVSAGQFVNADAFHQGSGTAAIYRLSDGSHVLRFEDFMVTNGPDLHVLLSMQPDGTMGDDYLDLGSLKGNVGSQNYDLPMDSDGSTFLSVIIYCQPFHVVFATAALQPN